ncbi:MAG: hypothetical protein L6R36_002902 [Xanthoria steineri]|nr:MAG: hypothetical protein L6R36_002902 [Xanthoria steineri]
MLTPSSLDYRADSNKHCHSYPNSRAIHCNCVGDDHGWHRQVRQVYIQTFVTTTTCKTTRIAQTPTTFTTTTTQTAFLTVTSAPVKKITTTITRVMTPTKQSLQIEESHAPSPLTWRSKATRTITATVTNTASPSRTASGVCETPPTVADTRNCNPINGRFDNEEADEHREAVFNQFHSGAGSTTDRKCAPANDSPGGRCDFGYWDLSSNYNCTLSACEAVQQCANDAVSFAYGSLDLHYLRSTQEWECFYWQYDQESSNGNTAADFNQANADVVVAYGYQVPRTEPGTPIPSMETETPVPSVETGAPETSL